MSEDRLFRAQPRATYRLQFSKDFRFDDARRIVPYLAKLGMSHVYASPLLMARPGSTHGYDIVDHNRLNPEIGDSRAFDAFIAELHRHDMGLILDFVPNHMGIGRDNPWWVDVLEWGRASPYADFFDIDWAPPEPTLAGKVLLPVLGDHYGAVLARGELQLCLDAEQGRFAITYFDNLFPIAPRDYPWLLQMASSRTQEAALRFEPIAAALRACLKGGRGRSVVSARRQRVAELSAHLASVLAQDPHARKTLDEALADVNGRPGQADRFDRLHELLERQAYRLAYWRVAAHEINYRRFFDINDLACLRMEEPELFAASHRLVGTLLRENKIQGLRLDHIDGLCDPAQYFARLQRLLPGPTNEPRNAMPIGRRQAPARSLYIVVEKILAAQERLPSDWAISGATGYGFMADVNGLFVDPGGERPLTRLYERLNARSFDIEEAVANAKYQIMFDKLASELNLLANDFNRLAKRSRNTRDYTLIGFREAIAHVVAYFPTYRTYVTRAGASDEDRRIIASAIAKARRSARTPDTSIYDFIAAVLTLDLLRQANVYGRQNILDIAFKFQQYTGPVMAKSVEDTFFYRYVRLVSLNDVGSEPGRFGTSLAAFHAANRHRLRDHPFSMVTTATHDHKRGEDVRARLNVLSEISHAWAQRIRHWIRLNERNRRVVDAHAAPSLNDTYLFYQTIVGAWPYELTWPDLPGIGAFTARIEAYMLKAVREAKLRTSWAAPNETYETALSTFIAQALDPKRSRTFIEDLCRFIDQIAAAGALNGLAQTLLKLISPGVPDTYQGTDYWDFSLVDPDNRRLVDYGIRQNALDHMEGQPYGALVKTWRDGRIKQWVICRALELRRNSPALFAAGDYLPLDTTGDHAGRLISIARRHKSDVAIAVVPRLAWPLMQNQQQPLPQGWGTTCVHVPADFPRCALLRDVISGTAVAVPADRQLAVQRLLAETPVALLVAAS